MSLDRPESSRSPFLGAGRCVFALFLVGLGIYGFVRHGFTPIWAPVGKAVPGRAGLIYACAAVSLLSGTGLLTRRFAGSASRLLLVSLLIWWAWLRLPLIAAAPKDQEPWSGGAETTVFVAASWILYAALAAGWDTRCLPFASGRCGVRIGRLLYGCALIPFGTAHFVYLKETVSLVPGWLPLPTYWAYLTGAAFIAAGFAIFTTCCARLAALLSACQLALFTLLVWVPILCRGHADAFQWSEAILSGALAAAAWVVTDSYRAPDAAKKV